MQVILKRLAIWLFEMALQAVMLGLFLIASHYDEHAFGKDFLFYVNMIALLFFTTGYLVSTAIVRAIWKGRGVWSHPTIVAALFLIHFEILNVGAGGAFEPPERLRLRIAGTCIAFASALVGGWLLRKWIRPDSRRPDLLPTAPQRTA
ncbi:MAG: hypothetical protein M3O20_05915 [Acidobacteriota bacterium]|nr:hypothetical protein [Acidobacteriota bacterium]